MPGASTLATALMVTCFLTLEYESHMGNNFNFRMKDEDAGEVPVAFVVKSEKSQATEDEIKQYISKQVNPTLQSIYFLLTERERNDKLCFH